MRRFGWAGNAMAEIGAVMAGEGVLGSSYTARCSDASANRYSTSNVDFDRLEYSEVLQWINMMIQHAEWPVGDICG